jgi:hypothetical protein
VSSPKGIGFVEDFGTVEFFDEATSLGTVALHQGTAVLHPSFATTGVHHLTATWSGTASAAGSTSATKDLTVSANVVHATGIGVSAATFYPVVDGYGDTVSIRGVLQEPGSIAITIRRASTNAIVRTLSVPLHDAGAYTIPWNGRSASGTLLAAGTFRVTQVVKDTDGATLSVVSSVTSSWKKLYWHSGTQTKYGNQYAAKGTGGGTIASTSKYVRGMRITLPLGTPGRWAALGYQFSLPSGTAYSSLRFWVLGSGTHAAAIGMQDRRLGTWPSGHAWIVDDFAPLATAGTSYAWRSVAGSATYNRIGRVVRGIVLAENGASST